MKIEDRNGLGNLLNHLGLTGLGAEVGVFKGQNIERILQDWKGYGIFLIDPYNTDKCGEYMDGLKFNNMDDILSDCKTRLSPFPLKTILINEHSDKAFELLKGIQLDWVYIDGNHHDPQLTKDLNNYWSLVKPGGMLCGHDYMNKHIPNVYRCDGKDAVDRFITTIQYKEFFVTPACTSWYIIK